jgi:hypothetical protein
MRKRSERHYVLVLVTCLMAVLGQSRSAAAQQEGSKDIGVVVKAGEVIERPKASVAKPPHPTTYRPSRPFTKAHAPNTEYVQLGITVWRLLKQDGSDPQKCEEAQLVQEVEGGAPLGLGSMVRIGIEPITNDGFLYIIDRELFADGTYRTTQLIFPKAGYPNNWKLKGELVLIPKPSCFRINPSKTGKMQIAEELTFIFSPTKLQLPAPLGEGGMPLSDVLFKSWKSQWSVPVNVLERNLGDGLATSVKAQAEGVKSMDDVQDGQHLTEEDPLPRTIYRAAISRGKALLVTVPLRFKDSASPGPKN